MVIGQEVCVTGYLEENYYPGGAQLAVKLIDQAGGVLGHKLELKTEDTQCIATNEITDANQLIDQFHAVAIIAGNQSAAIQGLIPTVQTDSIPFVAAGTLLQTSPWGVTTFPPNANVADTLVDFMKQKFPKDTTLANMSGNTPFGLAVQQDVQQYANQHGITTTQGEISNTATDATPSLQSVGGDSVYWSNTSGGINAIEAENAQSLGWTKPLIFQDGLTVDLLPAQQKYTNGKIYGVSTASSFDYFAHNTTMKAIDAKLLKLYRAQGGELVNFGSVVVPYDQINLLVGAMKSAGTVTSGAKIEKALTHETYTGADGVFSFKPGYSFGLKGNPYDVVDVSGDKLKVIFVPPAGY